MTCFHRESCRKAHVNLKLCGDIPWAIILMLLFGQYGKTTTLNALERYLKEEYIVLALDFQLMGTEDFADEATFVRVPPDLCQEIKKYLIVRCTVNLVDHQHNGLWRSPAHPAQPDEQLVRLAWIKAELVDKRKYFVVNRGRQYGKTTTCRLPWCASAMALHRDRPMPEPPLCRERALSTM